MAFEDRFSDLAGQYARHRPSHPQELFDYLAAISPGQDLAWDVGTGSGQAARQLADHFNHVIATDASQEQIEQASPHPKVEYRVEPAEKTSLPADAVDLITAAVSLHWFDFEAFYREVRRVSKPGAVLAAWTYFFANITPEIDALMRDFYYGTLAGYWSDRLRYVEAGYETLPFPFQEIDPPPFEMMARWSLADLSGFILSWSGTGAFIGEHGERPVAEFLVRLGDVWGDPEQVREVRWDLHMRIARVNQ